MGGPQITIAFDTKSWFNDLDGSWGYPHDLGNPHWLHVLLHFLAVQYTTKSPGRLGCRLLRPPFSKSTTAKLKLSALARTFAMRVSQWVTRHRYPLKYNSK